MRVGRPLKYTNYLDILDNETLYCPNTIASAGLEAGLMSQTPPKDRPRLRSRIRHTLACLAKSRHFPEQGDGLVKPAPKQQTFCPAWRGSRWKSVLNEDPSP